VSTTTRPRAAGSATATGAPLLQVDDVVVSYARRGGEPVRAVAGVSLRIAPGEVLGIVGESGCGKSTLARAVTGLAAPTSGTITFDGHPVTPMGRRRRPAGLLPLQMVFQDPYTSLNPRRRVGAQVGEVVTARARAAGEKVTAARVREESAEALERVGLPASAAGRFPHQFSGGQRQRVAIARALAGRPKLIVADEPVSALDASAQAQIANLLREITRDSGIGLAFISHDLAVVGALADRVAVMYLGEIVETGPTARVWNDPRHPYTRALLGAVPVPDGGGRRPTALAGEVPDPANPPAGCRFHPRCPLAVDRCATEAPPLGDRAAKGPRDDAVACWVTGAAD
jgi:peptide/nickel transport system ATP-binding protein